MKNKAAILFALFVFALPYVSVEAKGLTDDQIKQAIIQESIDEYSGNCPCPYNTAKNGSSCGKRSAYSRPGGEAPLCYKNDVTPAMVAEWKASHAQ
ncbi:MAG TPA: hypothetical protein VLB90_00870 [Pseudomonadales bacterium]|nr:hypothetical protein [Pseudomonadales bacterium]